MNATIQTLVDAVKAETTVVESAVTLIEGFAQRILDAVAAAVAGGVDAADLQALSDLATEAQAETAKLSAAVTANTKP